MSPFDFGSYVISQIPSLTNTQFQVEPLVGGFTNFTVRVTFDPPVIYQSTTLQSVVLKHAPPYVASSPDQHLSIHRQVVEAKALDFLSGKDSSFPTFAELSTSFPDLQFPKLIRHDIQDHVLWISDLGQCQSLGEYLKAEQPPPQEHVRHLADQLARFVCELYRTTVDPPEVFLNSLKDTSREEEQTDLSFLADLTRNILAEANVDDAAELAQVVLSGLQSKPEHPSLGMGDFWPASVLIDPQGTCGLIDWEYFGPCNPSSELGMFLAHLHVMSLDVKTSPSAASLIRAFTTTFLGSWKEALGKQDGFSISLRHALIAHGRELVNGVDLYSATLDSESKGRLIKAGVQSLRFVGFLDGNQNSGAFGFGSGEDLQYIWDDLDILRTTT